MEKLLAPFLKEHDAKWLELSDVGEEKLAGWKVHVGQLRREYAAWRDEIVKLMHVVNARTRQYHDAFCKVGIKRPIELLVMSDEERSEEDRAAVMVEGKGESHFIPCVEQDDKFGVLSIPTASKQQIMVDSEATLEVKDNAVVGGCGTVEKRRRRMLLSEEECTSNKQYSVENDGDTRSCSIRAGSGQLHIGGMVQS